MALKKNNKLVRVFLLVITIIVLLACRESSISSNPGEIQNQQSSGSQASWKGKTLSGQLGFLDQGDVWLLDLSTAAVNQVTDMGDVLSFVWSAEGEWLASFNGTDLCLVEMAKYPSSFCAHIDDSDARFVDVKDMLWSPDRGHILILGEQWWLVVPVEDMLSSKLIWNTGEWGVELAPEASGGYTGWPVFLPDGSLIGSLTQDAYCGSGGCVYDLYRFDYDEQQFDEVYLGKPEGDGGHLTISGDKSMLLAYGTYHLGCEKYTTTVDVFNLASEETNHFSFEQEAFLDVELFQDGAQAIVARGADCYTENKTDWAVSCGLSDDLDIFPMWLWKFQASEGLVDLMPGIEPSVKSNGSQFAFRSCLAEAPGGGWEQDWHGQPQIFVGVFEGENVWYVPVHDGSSPSWRPGVD